MDTRLIYITVKLLYPKVDTPVFAVYTFYRGVSADGLAASSSTDMK